MTSRLFPGRLNVILRGAVVLAVLVLVAGAGYRWLVRRPVPRNLILVSIDTLRADHLGSYGYGRETSPNLDRLARRSVVFRQAVAQAPTTLPSHAVLFTSRYWSGNPLPGEFPPVPEEWLTLAELLKVRGFATWGFVDGGYMGRRFGFSQGFDSFDDRPLHIAGILHNVERWLDTHEADRFFLLVHCYDVHSPYQPPPPFNVMFDGDYRGNFVPTAKNLEDIVQRRQTLTPEDLQHVVALYDGGIRYTDEQLGRFFDSLERRGLLGSSLLVVLSDHGEEFLEHGSMLHWQMHFSPNLHVPLIIAAPGLAPRSIEGPIELADFVPTVLELLGLPQHADRGRRQAHPAHRLCRVVQPHGSLAHDRLRPVPAVLQPQHPRGDALRHPRRSRREDEHRRAGAGRRVGAARGPSRP